MFGLDALFDIPAGLDQSITIAVLVGLVVMLLLAETFGWVFVGVVVPGYLASVMLIQPAAGIAVVLDSILTYLLARSLARWLEITDASSEFFGRERFFLIVLISVVVRQHTHNWLMPWAIRALGLSEQLSYEFQHSLASLGLVLVPLMANVFWKLDLRRGLLQSAVAVGVTYVVLAYWLLPTTSLSYNSLELSYENTALDFLGNAKAYLIMLVTAYISAQLNLRYGWDFGGILIPALLALLWFTPSKLATTLIESLMLFMAIKLALKAPLLRTANLEGPRKTALVFTVGVALKWLIGSVVGASFPTIKVTDLYGFGYLLPTLLTLRMLKRKSIRGVMLPTLSASVLGLLAASTIGFLLELAYPTRPEERVPQFEAPTSPLLETAVGVGAFAHARALDERVIPRTNRELAAWDALWEATTTWLEEGDVDQRAWVRRIGGRVNVELHLVSEPLGDRTAYTLVESEGDWSTLRRWDTALLIPGASGPVLEVPRPVNEALTAEAAMLICPRIDCRAVLVAGQDHDEASSSSFESAAGTLRRHPSVEIRSDVTVAQGRPLLEVAGELPPDIRLDKLWPTRLQLQWSSSASEIRGASIRMRVHPRDLEELLARQAPPPRHEIDLLPWLRARQKARPPRARQAALTELRALDHLVLERAWQWTQQGGSDDELDGLAFYAHLLGLEVVVFEHCGSAAGCLALAPVGAESAVAELVVLRGPDAEPLAIEIPRGGQVIGTTQLGLELWLQQNGRALVLSETAADDEASPFNPLLPGETGSSFQAIHQGLDRRLAATSEQRPLILQINGYSTDRTIDADVIIGAGRPSTEVETVPLPVLALFGGNGVLRFIENFRFSDATAELYALSGSGIPQFEYSLELGEAFIAGLWFSPRVRDQFRALEHKSLHEQLARLNLEVREVDEIHALTGDVVADESNAPVASREKIERIEQLAKKWAHSHNIHFGIQLLETVHRDRQLTAYAAVGLRTVRPMIVLEARDGDSVGRSLVFLDDAIAFDPDQATTVALDEAAIGKALLARPAGVRVLGRLEQEEASTP